MPVVLTLSMVLMCAAAPAERVEIPCFTFEELRAATNTKANIDILERVKGALDTNGPGVLCVSGDSVAHRVKKMREELLPMTVPLADESAKASNGREPTHTFRFNPFSDTPARSPRWEEQTNTPGDLGEMFQPTGGLSRLPDESDLPGFRKVSREGAQYLLYVGEKVAQAVSRALQELVPGYEQGLLVSAAASTPKSNHEGQLLRRTGRDWAPRSDAGLLTGIVPGVLVDKYGKIMPSDDGKRWWDADSGFVIIDRQGRELQGKVSAVVGEAIFFAAGASLQLLSGGVLAAAEYNFHGPDASSAGQPSLCTLAVLVQPQPQEELAPPKGMSLDNAVAGSEHLSQLQGRDRVKFKDLARLAPRSAKKTTDVIDKGKDEL